MDIKQENNNKKTILLFNLDGNPKGTFIIFNHTSIVGLVIQMLLLVALIKYIF